MYWDVAFSAYCITFDFRVVEEGLRLAGLQVRLPAQLDKHGGWLGDVHVLVLGRLEDDGKLQATEMQTLEGAACYTACSEACIPYATTQLLERSVAESLQLPHKLGIS